jgi:signal transduction histidine kinase
MVDVTALVQNAMESIRRRHDLAEESFQLAAPPRLETFTDPTALEIIVKNLLDNAAKYSVGTPSVQIELRVLNTGHLAISVRDQGIGIERRQLRRIFRRFHRAPDPLVSERSGSGLGLFVVERLVRNLGGRIRAESAGPGQGTLMLVRLPMSTMTGAGATA